MTDTETMTPFKPAKLKLPKVKVFLAEAMLQYNITRAQAKEQYNRLLDDKVFLNNLYQVNISDHPPWNEMGTPMIHISIKRLDKGHAKDWRHFQQIKNELVGPNHEAFELYPNEDRLVDAANQFHLWCFALPDVGMPIGFPSRGVESVPPEGSGVTQRPIEAKPLNESKPIEEVTIEQILEAAQMMDDADVPMENRVVQLMDPDTGLYVSSDEDPERVREIIQKFVGDQDGN